MNNLPIISSIIPWEMIKLRDYPINVRKKRLIKNINALDTETLNGYCKLIADNTTAYNYFPNINHKQNNINSILDFLTQNRFRNSYNFFYNLNYDVNAIIKYLPKKHLEQLYTGCNIDKYNKKTQQYEPTKTANTTIYKDYTIFYIPKKIMRISKTSNVYKYYDIAQFLGGSLEYNAKKYLAKDKYIHLIEGKKIDGHILGTNNDYWKANLPTIIDYCINDCVLTKELAEMVNTTVNTKLNLYPDSYISKASLVKEYVQKTVNIPDIKQIPMSALKYAFNSYRGGRFEVLKKGNVGTCTLVDINSAYPYHIKNLIDVTKGKWKRVNSLHESAYYGYYKVKVFYKYNEISPISMYLPNGTLIFPLLNCITYLTKNELIAYEKYIDYEIIVGWEYYPNEIVYPFNDLIDMAYGNKLKSSCEYYYTENCKEKCIGCTRHTKADIVNFEYSLFKIYQNGYYGATFEKYLDKILNIIKVGKHFNPIYATEITGGTRADIFKCAIPHIKKLVGFATDSCLFQGNPDIETSTDLGKWSIEGKPNQQTYVIRSGIYQIGDKSKNRGIKNINRIKTPHGEYNNLFDYIKKKPKLEKYPITMNRPITFIETIVHHLSKTQEDINIFMDMEYNIDINKDYKRLWTDTFKNGGEIFDKQIDSLPIIID